MQPGRLSLARLLAAGPALQATDWSLDDAALEVVLAELDRGPRRVVECGCGRSTVVIARALRELGGGEVHSLEHDPAWAQICRAQLAAEGLAGIATVVEAQLAAEGLAGIATVVEAPLDRSGWYAAWAVAELPDSDVELLLVDGPPAGTPELERSRYPALPTLATRLAEGAPVILDDAARAGERWVLERWEEELGVEFDRREAEGLAVGVYFAPGLTIA